MNRECPNCSAKRIRVNDVLFGNCRCAHCKRTIGVHSVTATFFSLLIFVTTSISTAMVVLQMGTYAALLWFTFPIGALSYLKARLGPLETKSDAERLANASDI